MADDDDEGGGDAWLVSYADLMTLLFAAFVVLYGTISQGTSNTSLGILATIRQAFVIVSASVKEDVLRGEFKQGIKQHKSFTGETFRETPSRDFRIREDAQVKFDLDKNFVQNLKDSIKMDEKSPKDNLRKAITIEENKKGVRIKLIGSYFYKKGEFEFTPEGRKRFLKLTAMLRKADRRVLIEGHASKNEKKGTLDAGKIAALRAAHASALMIDIGKISSFSIKSISYADTKPLSKKQTKEEQEKNRRIEIKIINLR